MKSGTALRNWLALAGWELPLGWCFWVCYVFGGSASPDLSQVPLFEVAFTTGFALCLASWWLKDARQRGIGGIYDFDTFCFATWTLFLPVYLFHTRGVRAFTMLGIFILLVVSASVIGFLLAMPFRVGR